MDGGNSRSESGAEQSADLNSPELSSQNSIACVSRRKRKPKKYEGYEMNTSPGSRLPRTVPPKAPANGSDSLLNFNPTLEDIKERYGDIEKNCNLKSPWLIKINLNGILNVLRELHGKKIDEFDHIGSLEPFYEVVRDLERLNIDIQWLRERLDQIKDAIESREQANIINTKKIERVKKVEELKSKIEKLENQLARENLVIENLDANISVRMSKVQQLQGKPLTDGLI